MASNGKIIWRKIVIFTVCILIVLGTVFHYSMALGLDAVGSSVLPTVTSTDFVVSPDLMDSDTEITAISPPESAVQYKNVVLALTMNRSDVDTARLRISSSTSLDFISIAM